MKRSKAQSQKVMKAFLKRACGYTATEEVRELKEIKNDDGTVSRELVLTKVVSKDVPPDLGAAKWYLENEGPPERENELTIEDARRLLDGENDDGCRNT